MSGYDNRVNSKGKIYHRTSDIYKCIEVYKTRQGNGKLFYRGKSKRAGVVIKTVFYEVEKDAAVELDKCLILAGYNPINVLKKK